MKLKTKPPQKPSSRVKRPEAHQSPDSKDSPLFALIVLIAMGVVMGHSVAQDSLTTDEGLYLPTGYYYLTEAKANLGYEHPPLVRDLAALPLLALPLRKASSFLNDEDLKNTERAVWTLGDRWLYGQPNAGPEEILGLARSVMILITMALGLLLYLWARVYYGETAARLTLLFYALSPFFLAHGRYVTTDVPSALGCLASLHFFYRYLTDPTRKRAAAAGAVLGLALLIKFPLASLIPFLALMFLVWVRVRPPRFAPGLREELTNAAIYTAAALGTVYLVYALHLINYPQADQIADMARTFQNSRTDSPDGLAMIQRMAGVTLLRPFAQYFYGMVWQVTRSGAFGYFAGEGSYKSWLLFYPAGFLFKTPLAFLALTAGAIAIAFNRARTGPREPLLAWVREHYWTLTAIGWIAYYLFVIIFLNSGNTGSRYLMPILPFAFMLVAGTLTQAVGMRIEGRRWATAILVLVALQALDVLRLHPSYLSYFNALAGGSDAGSVWLVDTDSEWGQDKRRLGIWAAEQGIVSIEVANGIYYHSAEESVDQPPHEFSLDSSDYRYYLGRRFKPHGLDTRPHGWFAIPARMMRWGQTAPAAHAGWYSQTYGWLKNYEPATIIGHSIWVYNLP